MSIFKNLNVICLTVAIGCLSSIAVANEDADEIINVDVAQKLYEISGLPKIEGPGTRCGGPCRGMCSSQPDCVTQNLIENIRIVEFLEGAVDPVDRSKIVKRKGKPENQFRANCSTTTNLPSIEKTITYSSTDVVELTTNTNLKNTKSKDQSFNIGATIGVLNIKLGNNIKNVVDMSIGQRTSRTFEEDHSVTDKVTWEPIPPREIHWLQFYVNRMSYETKFKGKAIVDADVISHWRVLERWNNNKLGNIWSTSNRGAISAISLPEKEKRTFELDVVLRAEGSQDDIFAIFNSRDVTDDDCPEWPKDVSEIDFPDNRADPIYLSSLSSSGSLVKTSSNSNPSCSVELSSANQSGNSLNVAFDVEVTGCEANHNGEIEFESLAENIDDGELVENSGRQTWNAEDDDNFIVTYRDSSHFGEDEEFVEISDIEIKCYCD